MSCTCGRSPTGKCVGWHKLSEEEYQEKKIVWEASQTIFFSWYSSSLNLCQPTHFPVGDRPHVQLIIISKFNHRYGNA